MSTVGKCPHGYFTHSPSNQCPWCFGFDDSNRDAVPVDGHGNGWLLRADALACLSCGGPSDAGWGMTGGVSPTGDRSTCYVCRIGDNTKDAIERRERHESARGQKKPRAGKPAL